LPVFQLYLRLNFWLPSGMTMERIYETKATRQCDAVTKSAAASRVVSSYGEELSRWFYRAARAHGIPEA